jgi:hypothetical protein
MVVGFLLGFVACWLFAGVLVMRLALSHDIGDWRRFTLVDDALPILIGVLVWPFILGRDDDDA